MLKYDIGVALGKRYKVTGTFATKAGNLMRQTDNSFKSRNFVEIPSGNVVNSAFREKLRKCYENCR